MTEHRKVQGDVNDVAVAYLYGVANFTGATVVGKVWTATTAAVPLTASVTIGVDESGNACGICTVDLGGVAGWLKTATPGYWFLEYEATFADGTVLTWPEHSPDTVVVRAQAS